MRPFFARETIAGYPIFMAAGGAFGYWLNERSAGQVELLAKKKKELLEKREKYRGDAGYFKAGEEKLQKEALAIV